MQNNEPPPRILFEALQPTGPPATGKSTLGDLMRDLFSGDLPPGAALPPKDKKPQFERVLVMEGGKIVRLKTSIDPNE